MLEHGFGSDRLTGDRRKARLPYRAYPPDAQPQFTPMPATQAKRPSGRVGAFQQNSGELGAVVENIVRPFDRKTPISGKDVAQRMESGDASDKAKFRAPCAGGAGSIRSRLA